MNVVIYARYSSDRQTEQSIEGQLKECYEYARRNGYAVVGEYIDRAISGTTDHRPEFLRMIADGDKKLFQAVLVYQLDRLARNRYDSATYKAKLKKNGIRVLSARENISDQDLSLLGFILNAGRSLVIVVNKWDGLDTDVKDRVKSELDRRLDFIDFARVHFISALHGSGVGNLFDSVKEAYECATQKMTTSMLTRILQIAVGEHQPPMISGRRVKLKYAHPGGYNPPIIVIHGNQVDKLPDSYKRYLSNHFRRSLKIIGSPIRLQFQEGNNPFAGKRNKLTPNQLRKRKRLMKFIKKSKK